MNTELESIIDEIDSLPSMPAVAVEVINLVDREDVDVAAIAEVIERDPALALKLLRVANSASFGLSREVSSINQALVVIGLRTVKIMVLGFSLIETWKNDGTKGLDYQRFWRVTLVKSAAARVLAERLGGAARDEAFVAGLLANIGILVLHSHFGDEYAEIMEIESEGNLKLDEIERNQWGVDHAEVGGRLLKEWGLPEIIYEPVRGHHRPERVEATSAKEVINLTRLLHLATITAELLADDPNEKTTKGLEEFLASRASEYFSKTPRDLSSVLEMVKEQTREVAEIFSVDIGGPKALDAIRDRAQRTLLNLSMVLAGENDQLNKMATTDALTGVANRGALDQKLASEIQKAARLDSAIGFLLIDVDHFKSVNDTHGHDVGDVVLKGIAHVLKKSVREVDLVARYGGEEFGIVCPTVTLAGLKKLAERVRKTVSMVRFPLAGGGELRVTISIGGSFAEDAEKLESKTFVKAADTLLYQAKHEGRNCARVFKLERNES